MQNIEVHRYANNSFGWDGYVEPEDKSWILFVPTDDSEPAFYGKRDPDTGGVIVD